MNPVMALTSVVASLVVVGQQTSDAIVSSAWVQGGALGVLALAVVVLYLDFKRGNIVFSRVGDREKQIEDLLRETQDLARATQAVTEAAHQIIKAHQEQTQQQLVMSGRMLTVVERLERKLED